MNKSAEQHGESNKVLLGIFLALAVGILFGLVVLGWGVFPVNWTDAAAQELRPDLKNDYLRMAIESYLFHPDAGLAALRWQSIGPGAYSIYRAIESQPQNLSPYQVERFYNAAAQPGVVLQSLPSRLFPPQYCESVTSTSHPLAPALIYVSAASILLSCGLLYVVFLKPRTNPRKKERLDPFVGGQVVDENKLPEPIGRYTATFAIGGDGYDRSFSVKTVADHFMGECGVNAFSSTIIGDSKVPDGFMVWLFDRNERQIAGFVLSTPRAFGNTKLRAKLEDAGEVVLMEPEKVVSIRTTYLQATLSIASLMYGDGSYPKGTVQRFDLNVKVWMINPETVS